MTVVSESENRILITPATTPGSIGEEYSLFVPHVRSIYNAKVPWYKRFAPPYAILTASILQILIFLISNNNLNAIFTFKPNEKQEAWRFLTYMLLHDSWFHLTLNILIQCLFAATLEKTQGHLRVGTLYLGGGALGAFGAACVRPDLVIGASAGVYALLTSHISHVILNFNTIKYKTYRCVSVLIIVASDVGYNLAHFYFKGSPIISWGAHAIGAVAGLFLGLVLYKNLDVTKKVKITYLFLLGTALTLTLVSLLFAVTLQINKCTPNEKKSIKYTYIC